MRRRPLLTALALALGITGLVAGPAQADTTDYVALGDSYSAGTGADHSGACFGSELGFPTLFAKATNVSSFTDATCGGAVTADVLKTQVSSLNAGTDIVTISIGGNDVGFANTVLSCSLGTERSCTRALESGYELFPTLRSQLKETYAQIRAKAPNAEVYVLGYPHLFEENRICLGGLSLAKREAINKGSDDLGALISAEATAAGFHYVDVRESFAGHGICARDSWMNSSLLRDGVGAYHPNAAGYANGYLPPLLAAAG